MIRFFEGCMRYGAAILFLFAFAQFLIGLIPLIYTIVAETGQMASDYNYTPTSSGIPFARGPWMEPPQAAPTDAKSMPHPRSAGPVPPPLALPRR